MKTSYLPVGLLFFILGMLAPAPNSNLQAASRPSELTVAKPADIGTKLADRNSRTKHRKANCAKGKGWLHKLFSFGKWKKHRPVESKMTSGEWSLILGLGGLALIILSLAFGLGIVALISLG